MHIFAHISGYKFCSFLLFMRNICYSKGMNIPELLLQFKKRTNVTNDYIADYCGVTKSTVSRWCTGKIRRIGPETMEKLADMLGVDLEEISKATGLTMEKPVLGTVKAGYGLLADENLDGYIEVTSEDFKKGDYFLRVTGNSMKDARIHDKDLLYIQSCSDVPSGTICVLLIGGEEVTVKKLIKKPNYWILQAANEDIEPRVYSLEEVQNYPVQVIGKVVYSKSMF